MTQSRILYTTQKGVDVKIGDLVYVPYYKEYGIIVRNDGIEDLWHVAYTSGCHSTEYEDDMEMISASR